MGRKHWSRKQKHRKMRGTVIMRNMMRKWGIDSNVKPDATQESDESEVISCLPGTSRDCDVTDDIDVTETSDRNDDTELPYGSFLSVCETSYSKPKETYSKKTYSKKTDGNKTDSTVGPKILIINEKVSNACPSSSSSLRVPVMKCDVCDVNLYTVHEVAEHYASKNHRCKIKPNPKPPPIIADISSDLVPTVAAAAAVISMPKSQQLQQNLPKPVIFNKVVAENKPKSSNDNVTGYRVVDIKLLDNFIKRITQHVSSCTNADLCLDYERTPKGFTSVLVWKCLTCRTAWPFYTESKVKKFNINTASVLGSVSIGIGFSQLNELFAVMGLRCMAQDTYKKDIEKHMKLMENYLFHKMSDMAKKVGDRAREMGNVDLDGVPYTTVILDGSWPKKSTGPSNNSSSGYAAVFDADTGWLLDIGTRNRYCATCALAEGKGVKVRDHACNQNYSGDSSGMEQEIVVELFMRSEQRYNLRYKYIVAEGDSGAYFNIPQNINYPVIRIESSNHLLEVYRRQIDEIVSNTLISVADRNLLKERRAQNLKTGISKAVEHYAKQKDVSLVTRVNNLKEDIRNAPRHIFGDHRKCRDYYCKNKNCSEIEQEINILSEQLETSEMFMKINMVGARLAENASTLVMPTTSNVADSFTSLVGKTLGGKRVNYSMGSGYKLRIMAAACNKIDGAGWQEEYCASTFPGSTIDELKKFAGKRQRERNLKVQNLLRKREESGTSAVPMKRQKKEGGGAHGFVNDVNDQLLMTEIDRICQSIMVETTESGN